MADMYLQSRFDAFCLRRMYGRQGARGEDGHLFMARCNRQLLTNLFSSQAGHTSLWMKDVPYFFGAERMTTYLEV